VVGEAARPATLKELLLFLLAAFAILAPGISSLPPVDRDEPRYETATTQMLASGDLIDIRYQNQPRYLQPAGVYWLQAIPTALFSTPDHRHVWTYRLPSLLGAVIASVITAWAASLIFGSRVGLSAGVLLAACVSLGFEARIGKTDGALLASVVVAQFSLMRAYLSQTLPRPPSWRWAAAFWTALGVGVLLKGPIVFLVSGLTVLALLLWDRRARWLKGLRALWGVPLTLLIALPWYIAIGLRSHGLFYKIAVGHSMLNKVTNGQQAHGAPFGYHLLAFPITFWPGSILAVMAIPFVWTHRREPAVRFLVAWIVPSWLVFEIIKTKLPHYVLPLFPAIACLAALALFSPKTRVRPWMKALFFAFAALWLAISVGLSVLGPVALHLYGGRGVDPIAVVLSLLSLLSVAALAWFLWRRRAERAIAAVVAAAFFTAVNAYAAALPRLSGFWLSPQIAAAARRLDPCPNRLLISTPFHEPSLVFLMGPQHTYLADTPREAADALARAGKCGLAVVGAKEEADFLARAAAIGLHPQVIETLKGRDYSDNRKLALSFYRAGS
jgi:4-amino-4-deoxy-L-arabinose transferase-like glycosyltransferase